MRPPLTDRQARALALWQYSRQADFPTAITMARAGIFPISGGGEVAFRKIQAGLETTRGTAVPATRKVYGNLFLRRAQPPIRPVNEDRGTLIKNYRSQPGLIEATGPYRGSATYEDLAWWMQLGLKGGVTGVVTGVTGYKYDFVPSQSADDLKSATFEWGDDTQAWQMPFGMLDNFTITGVMGQPWLLEGQLIGSDALPVNFTAALGDRVVEDIETHLTKLAIGNAGAIPTGWLTGRVIGFKLTVNNHLNRKYFMDGAATPVMGGVGRADRDITLEVTWEGNTATVAERALWVSGTSRVVHLQALGSAIAGGTAVKTADIVVPGKWRTFDPGDRATNTIFTAILDAEYDATLGNDLELYVINALSALP